MADGRDKSVDDGVGGFGGEKLRQHQIQEHALPDKHANSTGHETDDGKIVGAEFSGLDNDPVDLAPTEDDGRSPTNENEDELGLPDRMDTASQAVTQYDRAGAEGDVDDTAAGGLQYPDDDAKEPSR